jgi:hypothetical protein
MQNKLNGGPANTTRAVAPGANFSQFKERGGTDAGCILATSDAEMGKTGPGPKGCGENPAILHSRPRRWTRHRLRARLPLAGFSLATPSTLVGLTGPIARRAQSRFSSLRSTTRRCSAPIATRDILQHRRMRTDALPCMPRQSRRIAARRA